MCTTKPDASVETWIQALNRHFTEENIPISTPRGGLMVTGPTSSSAGEDAGQPALSWCRRVALTGGLNGRNHFGKLLGNVSYNWA